MIISAGFKEVGVEGARLENEVKDIARSYSMRIVGPNCLGILNTHTKCNASFAKKMPPQGNVSIITQSGALGTAILDWSRRYRRRLRQLRQPGQQVRPERDRFHGGLEGGRQHKGHPGLFRGITDGERFIEVARDVSKTKPVIVVKSGRTSAGARAVSSHTGSLAGSDAAYDSAFMQSGVIRAETMNEFFDMAGGFSGQPIPTGDRVVIVTNAGGPGILATDSCERHGLTAGYVIQGDHRHAKDDAAASGKLL